MLDVLKLRKQGDGKMQENLQVKELFEKYADMVYRIAVSNCKNQWIAEDVVQDVFLRYIKKKPVFANETHEKAWFIRVAINCSKSQMTCAWMKRTMPMEETTTLVFENPEQELFFEMIQTLSTNYRTVLYLRYYEEYSVSEIADILHISENTVSARLSRARKKLKTDITSAWATVS